MNINLVFFEFLETKSLNVKLPFLYIGLITWVIKLKYFFITFRLVKKKLKIHLNQKINLKFIFENKHV
jgi:hypothetical protein